MKKRILSIFITLIIALFLVSCKPEELTSNKKEYTISFVTNGGTPIDSFKFEESFDTASLINYETIKTNYNFVSWHTSSSLSDESLASGTYHKSTTFYAKWKEIELEAERKGVEFIDVPEYYFEKELREANEI